MDLDTLIVILCIIAIAITTIQVQEHMTSQDLLATLKKHGDKGTSKSKTSKETIPESQIMGPDVGLPDPAPSKPSSSSKDSTGVYPEIYGPDLETMPGTKHLNPKSDNDVYDYNPSFQKAFESDGVKPYLDDFSKFASSL